jgi:hypothetical protein
MSDRRATPSIRRRLVALAEPRVVPASSARRSRGRRFLRAAVVLLVAIGVLLGAILAVAKATTGHSFWSRVIAWQQSDFGDWRLFPSRPVPNDPGRVLQLSLAAGADAPWPYSVTAGQATGVPGSLEDVLASSGTAAFLVPRATKSSTSATSTATPPTRR